MPTIKGREISIVKRKNPEGLKKALQSLKAHQMRCKVCQKAPDERFAIEADYINWNKSKIQVARDSGLTESELCSHVRMFGLEEQRLKTRDEFLVKTIDDSLNDTEVKRDTGVTAMKLLMQKMGDLKDKDEKQTIVFNIVGFGDNGKVRPIEERKWDAAIETTANPIGELPPAQMAS